MLRDVLACIHAVMHASPTRTMIRADSITVALDPPTIKRFTKRLTDPAPTRGAVREVLLELWTAPRPPNPLRLAPTPTRTVARDRLIRRASPCRAQPRSSQRLIPTRVKADSFRGFQTGASQTLWRRTGGSPCGQELRFARTMTRPSFGHW